MGMNKEKGECKHCTDLGTKGQKERNMGDVQWTENGEQQPTGLDLISAVNVINVVQNRSV